MGTYSGWALNRIWALNKNASEKKLFRENFSEKPAFNVKSNWNPPKCRPALEIFCSKLEDEVFSVLPGTPRDYNLSKA